MKMNKNWGKIGYEIKTVFCLVCICIRKNPYAIETVLWYIQKNQHGIQRICPSEKVKESQAYSLEMVIMCGLSEKL